MTDNTKYLRIGPHTYGFYEPKTGMFTCTHGAWSSRLTFINENTCFVHEISRTQPQSYVELDAIPDDYNYGTQRSFADLLKTRTNNDEQRKN